MPSDEGAFKWRGKISPFLGKSTTGEMGWLTASAMTANKMALYFHPFFYKQSQKQNYIMLFRVFTFCNIIARKWHW